MPILLLGGLALVAILFMQKQSSAKPDRGAWDVMKPHVPLPSIPVVGNTVRFLIKHKNGGNAVMEGKILNVYTDVNPINPEVVVRADKWLIKEGLQTPNPPVPSEWTMHVSDFAA